MSPNLVADYYRYCDSIFKPIDVAGVHPKQLLNFVRYGNNQCPAGVHQISRDVFKINRLPGSIRNARELAALPLADGFYICGAFNPQRIAHAFLLTVREGATLITDEDHTDIDLVKAVDDWLVGVRFLHKEKSILPYQ
jgi:hypothetical protein